MDTRDRPERSRHLQLALFGPAVRAVDLPEPVDPDLPEVTLAEVAADLDEAWNQLDLFIDGFPAEQHDAVIDGMYTDADGQLRTTHAMLRVV